MTIFNSKLVVYQRVYRLNGFFSWYISGEYLELIDTNNSILMAVSGWTFKQHREFNGGCSISGELLVVQESRTPSDSLW